MLPPTCKNKNIVFRAGVASVQRNKSTRKPYAVFVGQSVIAYFKTYDLARSRAVLAADIADKHFEKGI